MTSKQNCRRINGVMKTLLDYIDGNFSTSVSRGASRSMKLILCLIFLLGVFRPAAAQAARNFVVLMPESTRFDAVWAMPNMKKLASEGVSFRRAYGTTPLCGPQRNSFLSGGFYPQSTGITENGKNNGWGYKIKEMDQLALALQRAGYRTAMVGKAAEGGGSRVPAGWDWYRSFVGDGGLCEGYVGCTYKEGSSQPDAAGVGTLVQNIPYSIDYEREQALAFLDKAAAEPSRPFFLLLAPAGPMHEPAIPDPTGVDDGLFTKFSFRGRGYGETDLINLAS